MVNSKIREIRKAKGFTQRALGEKIGVVESTIRAYETGRCKINSDIVEKLAIALNVDISEFYTDQEYIKEGKVSESLLIKLLNQLVELGTFDDVDHIPEATMNFINQEVKKEIIRIKNEKDTD